MVSAANNQVNYLGVKVLRQKDETRKMEKKIAETEVETKTSKFFSDFQTVLLSEQEDVVVIPSTDFTKKQKSREKNCDS
jgi:hypothetical protein